jgi:hypothetical protein
MNSKLGEDTGMNAFRRIRRIFHRIQALFFFSFFFYYSYVHTRLGSFLPPAPTSSLTTHSTPSLSPLIPSRNYFALISNFVVERL